MQGHYSDVWQGIARAMPDRTAIRSVDGQSWSYERFAREAGALAAAFAERGLRAGDVVAILLHNRPEFLITLFACLATGLTPAPLNFRFRPGEVAALLDDSAAKALVFPTSLTPVARDAASLATADDVLLVHIVDDDTTDAPGLSWDDAVAADTPLPTHPPESGELWIYTGGTTGRPKAVRWHAPALLSAQQHSTYSLTGLPLPQNTDDAIAIAGDPALPLMVNLPLAPFMHGTALTTSMSTLLLGGTVLVTSSPRLDAEAAVRFALDQHATRIIVAGDAVAIPLVEAAERLGVRLDGVTSVMSSGMRFSPETKRRLHELADMTIIDLLASTEGGGFAVTTTTGLDDLPGRPQLFPTAVVFDEDFNEVQDQVGAIGVLAQRGALPLGYHGDLAKTEEAFPQIGGVRHVVPGDWVRVEDDRHIEFLGRRSGVINTGGEKVYPLEVEEALVSHPAVADVVVLGAPDPRFGEIVAAVVEVSSDVTEAELLAHVDAILAGYKKPRHILFRPSLERTPHGKVDVNRWRQELIDDRDRKGMS